MLTKEKGGKFEWLNVFTCFHVKKYIEIRTQILDEFETNKYVEASVERTLGGRRTPVPKIPFKTPS